MDCKPVSSYRVNPCMESAHLIVIGIIIYQCYMNDEWQTYYRIKMDMLKST